MLNAVNKPQHILVVNDTEEILDLFRDIIEGMGLSLIHISEPTRPY